MLKNYVSWLLCLVFLSTIFVGCDQQEHPPKSPFMVRQAHQPVAEKKVVEKKLEKVSEKPAFVPVAEITETFVEEEPVLKNDERSVIVNVTAEGLAIKNAMVTLASKTPGGNFLREKKTDETGTAKFSIPKTIFFFYVTAYNEDYAAVNIMKGGISPIDLSPITIDLVLQEKGVIITGILEDKPEKLKGFNARIEQSEKTSGYPKIFVISTNIIGNKIKFPPIESNLKGLRVCVEGENIPQCYSEVFDTKEGENKEVKIEIPMNVTLKGIASLPDGSPVTNSFTALVFPVDKSKGIHQAGVKINQQIHPENDGSYELSGLAQGNFEIRFMLSNYKSYETKLCLVPPETELDFSFVKVPESSFCGIVINGYDKDPIEGVTVSAHEFENMSPYASCVTDKDGSFLLDLKESHQGYFGCIIIEEPGYGKVVKSIQKENKFVKIVLHQGGNVFGKITIKNGKPLSEKHISIIALPVKKYRNTKKVSSTSDPDFFHYQTKTDSEGNYEFSNINAPARYGFQIHEYSEADFHSGKGFFVEVKPDKTIEYDIAIEMPGIVAFKGEDKKGTPVLKYNFTHNFNIGHQSSIKEHVNVSEDEWHYFALSTGGDGLFSCNAIEKEGGFFSFLKPDKKSKLTVITNNIPVFGQITNYITLIFSKSKINLTGYLLKPNGSPANYINVRAWVHGKGRASTMVDKKGYFEINELKLEEGEMMNIEATSWQGKTCIYTNLASGSKNVKLTLQLPNQITGNVFLEDLETAAKTFVVNQNYNKQSYNSKEGTFKFLLQKNIKKGFITIFTDNYLPEFKEFNFINNSVCDVGNIILKPGETANIKGRIIDQKGNPFRISAVLKYKEFDKTFSSRSNEKNGNYGFEGVPPGKATIFVFSKNNGFASHDFIINEGDELELPDLILRQTNSVESIFK